MQDDQALDKALEEEFFRVSNKLERKQPAQEPQKRPPFGRHR